jgi:periplasmic protein TonB
MALTSTIHSPDQLPAAFRVPPRQPQLGSVRMDRPPLTVRRPVPVDFAKLMIEENRMTSGRRAVDVAISLVLHVVLIAVPIFLSLWYTDTLNLKAYTQMLLVGPPPPAPPPPAAAVVRTAPPKQVFFEKGRLLAPTAIPKQVAMLQEAPVAEESGLSGVPGGVPGGIPGGQIGGVLGGILGGIAKPSAPTAPQVKTPLRVGGRIRPPRAIYNPPPDYPLIARQAKVQGTVVIRAIVDERGNVTDMQVISGHLLLIKAALEAVAKWKYQPTFLNDEPVPIEMNITVYFQLN